MKLPRTIRLDPSDTFIFERAAEPGEWAISGSFLLLDGAADELTSKARHALRSGFLGIASLGFSTLVAVSLVTPDEYDAALEQLARGFVETLGAPDLQTARQAARDELIFAASLCDYPEGTLLAVQRSFDEAGQLREQFRTLRPRDLNEGQDRLHAFARAFTFHEVEEEGARPDDHVDLAALIKPAAKPETK